MRSNLRMAVVALAILTIAAGCGSAEGTVASGAASAGSTDVQLLALDRGDASITEMAGRSPRAVPTTNRARPRHWMGRTSSARWAWRRAKRGRYQPSTTMTTLEVVAPEPSNDGSGPSTTAAPGTPSTVGGPATTVPGVTSPSTTSGPSTTTQGSTASTQRGVTTQRPPSSPSSSSSTTQRQTTTARQTTTTARQTTTTARQTTTTARTGGGSYFATLSPGSALPSGEWCAGQVKPRPEVRSGNATYNQTRGSAPNGRYPRVDGDFSGTTDEIIQWAACKWGIDEDWARAQAAKESWWDMTVGGDRSSDQSACHPELRTSSGTCPESIGLLQVRYLYHQEAFADSNAIRSTAYNIDYTYAVWRSCYNGELGWLNDVERGAQYAAGDLEGCLGVWFSGRWYVPGAITYIDAVRTLKNTRVWEQGDFLNY